MNDRLATWKKLIAVVFALAALMLVVRACNDFFTEKKTKVYQLARKDVVYPVNLTGKERYLSAFSDDLLQAVAKSEQIYIDISVIQTPDIFMAFDNPQYDGVITRNLPGALTRDKYVYSEPFFILGPVVVVRKNSDITSVEQLKGRIVGARSSAEYLSQLQNIPDVYIRTFDNYAAALENLSNNKIDAVVMEAWPAHVYTQGFYSDRLKVATTPINKEGLRVIARNDATGKDLVEAVNGGLERLRKDGIYKALILRWGLIDTEELPK